MNGDNTLHFFSSNPITLIYCAWHIVDGAISFFRVCICHAHVPFLAKLKTAVEIFHRCENFDTYLFIYYQLML